MFTFRTPVMFDTPDDGGVGELAGLEGLEGLSAEDIASIAPAPEPEAEFELPESLPEGVEQFDRKYVETLRQEAARRRTENAEFKEKFGDLDPERARAGVTVLDKLATKEGVVEAYYETAVALGMDPKDVEANLRQLLGEPADPNAIDEEDPDLDVPLTKREILEILSGRDQASAQTEQERQAEAFQTAAHNAIVTTFDGLKVTDEAERQVLLGLGDQIADKLGIDKSDISKIPEVLQLAAQEFERQAVERARKLVEAKRLQAIGSPTNVGGGSTDSGTTEPVVETRTLSQILADKKQKKTA